MLVAGLGRMQGRDPGQHERVSTLLELFDLCFVVAVSFASITASWGSRRAVHRRLRDGVLRHLVGLDGVHLISLGPRHRRRFYRIAALVQIAGVLVLAAGVEDALAGNDHRAVTIGYLITRAGWSRSGSGSPSRVRQAAPSRSSTWSGLTVIQLGRPARLWLPEAATYVAFVVLVGCEPALPAPAARRTRMSWHPGHIAARYGLLTLIVLGESVLASSNAVVDRIAKAAIRPRSSCSPSPGC